MSETGQIALVTGASRGLGSAIAIALAESGRHVIVNYRSREDKARETLAEIERLGATGELAHFDVAQREETTQAVEALLEKHERIDVLVNNAGIREDELLVWMKPEAWDKVLDVNLSGFYNVTRLIVKHMMVGRFGRIINISSTSGQIGMAGQVNYAASKAGLIGATRSLAREIAKRKVTVNVVAPGFIETDMLEGLPKEMLIKEVPMQRIGRPEEVAGVVVFLCSDVASYITGQIIGVNGGIC